MIRELEIPFTWKEKVLGNVVEILSSKRIFAADYVPEGILFYRSKEIIEKSKGETISNPLYITKKRFEDIKNKYGAPVDGDLLISAVGERAGIPYHVKNDGDFYFKDGNLIWFRNFSEDLNSQYLCFFLKSRIGQHKLDSLMIGSAQKALTIVGLKSMDLTLPPLAEQKSIAAILTAFDDKIELLQAQNKTLEATAQTIFKEWFGKYQIGDELPEGWRVGKLDDVIEFTNGYAFKSKELLPDPSAGTLKIFKMGSIKKGGGFNPSKTKSYINRENTSKLSKYVLKSGDLLMSMTDMKDAISLLGHTALMIYDDEYIVNQRVGLIRAQNDLNIDFPFLYLLTNDSDFIADLRGRSNSGVQVNLSTQAIKESELIIPDKATNLKFDLLAKPLLEKIKRNTEQIQTLTQTRDALLPKLMGGEIRVYEFNS
jgi:type I restriction enzyme S subunit